MRKILTMATCIVMALGITGCGDSRKALTDEEVQKHFESKGYTFACATSGFEFCGFANTNDKAAFLYTNKDNTKFAYMKNEDLYSVEDNKILEGSGDVSEMKKQYDSIMKNVDVTTDEATKFLKAKYESYVSEQSSKKKEEENKVYKVGDTLTVTDDDNKLFTFKVNSVKSTDERNEFNKSKPAQVIVINYSYDNINLNEDLYISSPDFTVIDEGGNVVDTYPAGADIYPKESPKGAKSDGEEAYGLKQKSKTIKMRFSKFLPNGGGKIERTFELKID